MQVTGFSRTYLLSSGVNMFISDSKGPTSLVSINRDNELFEMRASDPCGLLIAHADIPSYDGIKSLEKTIDMLEYFLKSIEKAMEIEKVIRREIGNLTGIH